MRIDSNKYRLINECRSCSSKNLEPVIHLGSQPLAGSFIKSIDESEPYFPLSVVFCTNCYLLQLDCIVDRQAIFEDYIYFSSPMPKLSDHFKEYAIYIVNNFIDGKHDLVVEVGSNDGILLKEIKNYCRVLGVDPAKNVISIAEKNGVPTIPKLFGGNVVDDIATYAGHSPIKVIIGNNVFAHVDDIGDFLEACESILTKNGIMVFEFPYLMDMFENLSFDTIYHEHLSYFSVISLCNLFHRYGFEIFDIKQFPVQGQSIRVFVKRIKDNSIHRKDSIINKMVFHELEYGIYRPEVYKKLMKAIDNRCNNIVQIINNISNESSATRFAGYGAPGKGNTFLNYAKISTNILEYLTEELESKYNLYSPGMHIPVKNIKEVVYPDVFLMLAWNYANHIIEKERGFIEHGGSFIIPIGKEVRII